jgi:hypothetical protein
MEAIVLYTRQGLVLKGLYARLNYQPVSSIHVKFHRRIPMPRSSPCAANRLAYERYCLVTLHRVGGHASVHTHRNDHRAIPKGGLCPRGDGELLDAE